MKSTPLQPLGSNSLLPLAHGAAARVVRLRGYGNAIVAAQAQGFIEAVFDTQRFRLMSEMTPDTHNAGAFA